METLSASSKTPFFAKLKAWGLKPLVLDFYVQRVWPTFSLERIFANLVSVRPASSTAVTICLRPNFNFKNFRAGQHVLITASVNGHRLSRTYSPTRLADGTLEITVKQVPNGKVSTLLGAALKPGSTFEMSPPFGNMTWEQIPKAAHYVFCAGGVGMTPLRSLIHAWDQTPAGSIELHYWAKIESEFCFVDELREIAARHPELKLHFHASDQNKIAIQDVIAQASVVVACGPQNFVRSARIAAEKNGQTFFGESAPSIELAAELAKEQFFEVVYDGQVIQASSNKTILESLEEQGLSPVHGCRMGICKSCTCLKAAGTTFSSRDMAQSSEDNEEIQICVATPRSAIRLERY